ncbi:MAG: LD-carboxypeptidase [Bacteroidota bacterium]
MIKQPPFLRKGDTIGIVCPSGHLPIAQTAACVQQLKHWGFQVKIGPTVGGRFHSFAGTDEERCADLQQMIDDPSINAILCGRGGYGLSRIIDQLDFSRFRKHPKWIIGFSDITVLHAHLYRQFQICSLHAPMARAFSNKNKAGIETLHRAMIGRKLHYSCKPHAFNRQGQVSGPLIGGNLSLIAHLTGTKSALPAKGAILFLEDVGEYIYNIDRMMIQLKRSGLLGQIAGLIVGGFSETKDTAIPFGASPEEVIRAQVAAFDFPVCFGFPVSHEEDNLALKHGAMHHLHISGRSVRLEEISAV